MQFQAHFIDNLRAQVYNVTRGDTMLGENIRNLRKENKMSQEQLAEKLDVSRQSISLWENGQTTPSMENIVAIADIFDVSTDILLKDCVEEIADDEKVKKQKPRKKGFFIALVSIVVAIIVAVSAFVINNSFDKKLSAEEIFDLIAPCTVEINAEGDTFSSTGTGSFIDGNGTIITNYHVIESCHTINVATQDGNVHKVESILGFDKERDLAIIKIDSQNEKFVTLKSENLKTGEKIYTLGSSLGLTGTFSEGIISSSSREIDGLEFIQITAPISSGNSGGPLVDEYGNVIGITTGAFTEGQNLNLAIPVRYIDEINRETEYSINDFFLISQGKVVQKPSEESKDEPEMDENYVPVDIGYFDSIEDLEEATQRNPSAFKLPVIVSVYGIIIRTSENLIYIVDSNDVGNFLLYVAIEENNADYFDNKFMLSMIDDTVNRVISGDKVVIKGVYRHSAKTISDCTYELVE